MNNPNSTEKTPLTTRLDVDFALKAARLGVWELDPTTNLVNWDDRCRELFGLNKDNLLPYEQAIRHIHPDDVSRVDKAVQWAMNPQSGGEYDLTYRTVGADDGLLRYVRFTGQGYFDKTGAVTRFAGIAQDVTKDIVAQQQLDMADLLRAVFDSSQSGISVLKATRDEVGNIIDFVYQLANRVTEQLNNRDDLVGKLYSAVHTAYKQAGLFDDFVSAIETGQPVERTLHYTGEGFDNWYETVVVKNDDGVVLSFRDITERKQTDEALRASEQRFQAAIAAVQGILWTNNANGEMEGEQPGWATLTGQTPDEYRGYGWAKAVHPDDAQPTVAAWNKAVAERTMFVFEHRVRVKTGAWEQFSVRAIPLMNADGTIREWVGVHTNVTEQRKAEESLRASEVRFRNLVAQATVATAVFTGRNMVLELANDAMITLWAKNRSIIGQTLLEFLPEMADQPFPKLLDTVFTTGETFTAQDAPVRLERNSKLEIVYMDFSYQALRDTQDTIFGILVMATDVMEKVKNRQTLEEAEASLRGAVELAQLGTWSLDIERGTIIYSTRFMDWLGFSEDTKALNEAYNPLPDEYRQSVTDAIAAVIQPGSSGLYENEHPIINRLTGQIRIIHAQAQVFYDATGKPAYLTGTAQDVTEQRRLQQELERQVQERTEEVAATNEELAAANEELACINEELAASNEELATINNELSESNGLLNRSNQNLQQFAYVASHDLQEPLRKIQSFGDLLKTQYADQLGEGVDHLNRMQTAAGRMSVLIKDLLSFSRISTQRESTASVSLIHVVHTAMNDLDLVINETGAKIRIEPLPVVRGDRSQLGQLFQNLLSNALKFHKPGTTPIIQVRNERVAASDLPASVRPTRMAGTYHRIDVSDNGIGFDEKYVDRIFQVFQRLHTKSQFAGTGIGLAICEKVATNHGGAISATSQVGQGTTFSVYLPVLAG